MMPMEGNFIMSQTVEHRGGGRTQAQVKPWAIVHSPPKQKHVIAQRYFNRQDAEDSLRFLKRWVQHPQNFAIAFLGDKE
jgi:predicted acyl esterase